MNKKIIAVDFDGTLVFNEYPKIENPNVKLLEFIQQNRKKYIWILYTLRHGKDLQEVVKYLKKQWKIKFDYINENVPWLIQKYGDSRKIYADYYIDDKNLMLNNYEDKIGRDENGK